MSTMMAKTESAQDVDVDEVLTSLMETGSCCAEVGLGGFLPGMRGNDVVDLDELF